MSENINETFSSDELAQDLIYKNNNNKPKQSLYIIPSSSSCSRFSSHLRLMLWKNFLIFKRNYISTLSILLTPVFVCLLLSTVQYICTMHSSTIKEEHPPIEPVSALSRCTVPSDCTTIAYSIIKSENSLTDDSYIDKIMSDVAYLNGLSFNEDVKLATTGSYDNYLEYLEENKNKTKYGVLFCVDYFVTGDDAFPCKFEIKNNKDIHLYTIMYNMSNVPNDFLLMPHTPYPTDTQLTKLKISIDNAYINHFYNSTKPLNAKVDERIKVSLQKYPSVENRKYENENVEATSGTLYFFFPPMFCFMFFLLEIVREKDLNLRKSLLIIGLNDCSFWMSWILSGIIFSIIMTGIFIVTAWSFQYQVIHNTPIPVIFILFFLFSVSMVFFAIFLSTLISNMKMAYTVSYTIFLVGMVMEILLRDVDIVYSLYSDDLSEWLSVALYLFQLYPPFNFSKAFNDISYIASPKFKRDEQRFIDGSKYKWKEDLFNEKKGKILIINSDYTVPPTYLSFVWLVINSIVFMILTWYIDNVNASNKGRNLPWYFPITKEYWKGKAKRVDNTKQTSAIIPDDNNYENDPGLQTVEEECKKVCDNLQTNNGLNINGVSKIFNLRSMIPCYRNKQLHALKPTYLHIPYGELFTILGHNGAGKSTLINILTGNLSATSGDAEIGGYNLTTGLKNVIGLCPQHDILWEELTAVEHLQIYCRIRNFRPSSIPSFIKEKLATVNLSSDANKPIRTYSGGMKRRLSILLSTIGNQKVVFLDEPTTGLDPVNRRFIWKMIQELKNDLAIVLTTHSMEEADYLSDRIAIIKKGKLKCIGSPLELKKMYGGGYLLTFICSIEFQPEVKKRLKYLMPSCSIVSANGGNILISVPFDKVGEMKYLSYIMNNKFKSFPELNGLDGLIKECGMSYTTIEEVFLKITGEKNDEDDDDDIIIN